MEELDLLKLLIPGVKVYSAIHLGMRDVLRITPDSDLPIAVGLRGKASRTLHFNRRGSVLRNGRECLLFPDKDTHTWEGYVTPCLFERGDVVKAFAPDGKARVAIYSHFDEAEKRHCCYAAISEAGEVELERFERVDKFRVKDGYLFSKQLYSKAAIGRAEKGRGGGEDAQKDAPELKEP